MITYLLRSTLCLGALWLVYRGWLERESCHRFKRAYLLASLILGLILPLISLEIPVLGAVETEALTSLTEVPWMMSTPLLEDADEPLSESTLSWFHLVWVIYGGIVLLQFLRKGRVWLDLHRRIQQGSRIPFRDGYLVLSAEEVAPHSFGRNVLVSERAYQAGELDPALLEHEYAHVQQYHSLDILLLQLLSVCCWWQPMLRPFAKAIRLNHEFLADEVAVQQAPSIHAYQHLLLNQLRPGPPVPTLASASTFFLTQQRFTMMHRTNSPKRNAWKSISALLIMLVVGLIAMPWTFAQQPPPPPPPTIPPPPPPPPPTKAPPSPDSLHRVKSEFYGNGTIKMAKLDENGEIVRLSNGKPEMVRLADLSEEEKKRYFDKLPAPMKPQKRVPTQADLQNWLDPAQYGVWIDGRRVENEVLKQYQPRDFAQYHASRLMRNAANYGKHVFQLNLTTQAVYEARVAEYEAKVRRASQ
ncbi:MAG: hypothetical protein AAF399_30650 [Bacteroidota bacterium]